MNYQAVKDILATSSQDDWLIHDQSGCFTYKHDLHLHILRDDSEESCERSFIEDWAVNHPDPNAKRDNYTVKYGSSIVEEIMLVSVDGHRASLPLPKSARDLRVSPASVNFAKIVCVGLDETEDYLRRSGIEIDPYL